MMRYVLHGKPTPQARPRFGKGYVYDVQEPIRNFCKLDLKAQHKNKPLFEGRLHIEINFYMKMPAYWKQSKKIGMVGKYHACRPDFSNLLKFVEDCGTGILYKDDAQICSVVGKKIYDWYPKTELIITEIK